MKRLIFLFTVFSAMFCNASISKTLRYSQLHVDMQTIAVRDENKTLVTYDNLPQSGIADMPSVPCQTFYFSVPLNATDFHITYTTALDTDIALSAPIMYNTPEVTGSIPSINPPPQIIHGTKAKGKNTVDAYGPMVVPGRTWWYESMRFTDYDGGAVETGISIGDEIEIDGKIYNKVYVKYFSYDVWPWAHEHPDKYTPEEGILGYIREDDGIIYFRDEYEKTDKIHISFYASGAPDKSTMEDDNGIYLNRDRILYSFNNEQYKIETSFYGYDYTIMRGQYKTIENSGRKFHSYKCAYESLLWGGEAFMCEVIPEIGANTLVGSGSSGNVIGLFCYPFNPSPTTCLYPRFERIRYVTDGDDNHILFEGEGGLKLWENYSGVDDISADADTRGEQWFDLNGRQIRQPLQPGLYIHKVNGKTGKKMVY